jgi:hypothetical protein
VKREGFYRRAQVVAVGLLVAVLALAIAGRGIARAMKGSATPSGR